MITAAVTQTKYSQFTDYHAEHIVVVFAGICYYQNYPQLMIRSMHLFITQTQLLNDQCRIWHRVIKNDKLMTDAWHDNLVAI